MTEREFPNVFSETLPYINGHILGLEFLGFRILKNKLSFKYSLPFRNAPV